MENLVENYRTIRDVTVKGIPLASEEEGHITEDLLIGYQEKTLMKNKHHTSLICRITINNKKKISKLDIDQFVYLHHVLC